jgi:hypothetical protein
MLVSCKVQLFWEGHKIFSEKLNFNEFITRMFFTNLFRKFFSVWAIEKEKSFYWSKMGFFFFWKKSNKTK